MTFASDKPRGAWWKQLSEHIHARTGRQLRRLQIRMSAGRITIAGRVPTEAVRRQAEEAAREVVPDGFLSLLLRVDSNSFNGDSIDGEGLESSVTPPALAKADQKRSNVFLGTLMYRRLYGLVSGN